MCAGSLTAVVMIMMSSPIFGMFISISLQYGGGKSSKRNPYDRYNINRYFSSYNIASY